MSDKFTPGPWKWDSNPWDYDSEQEAPWLVTADDKQDRIVSGTVQCSEANARLISAAPELLTSLIEMLAEAEGWLDDSRGCKPDGLMEHGAFDRAYAVIAKATGAA